MRPGAGIAPRGPNVRRSTFHIDLAHGKPYFLSGLSRR
jgi:hypothetical protein